MCVTMLVIAPQVLHEIDEVLLAHGPVGHGIIQTFSRRIDTLDDGSSEARHRICLVIAVTVGLLIVVSKECLRCNSWCDDPEPRHHARTSLAVRAMTARATTPVHPDMHVSTAKRNRVTRGAYAGEVDPFAVILKAAR